MIGKKKTGVNKDPIRQAYDAFRAMLGKKQQSKNKKINQKRKKK